MPVIVQDDGQFRQAIQEIRLLGHFHLHVLHPDTVPNCPGSHHHFIIFYSSIPMTHEGFHSTMKIHHFRTARVVMLDGIIGLEQGGSWWVLGATKWSRMRIPLWLFKYFSKMLLTVKDHMNHMNHILSIFALSVYLWKIAPEWPDLSSDLRRRSTGYPLANKHHDVKSPVFMGKST